MPDQDDESATTTFVGGFKKGISDVVAGAAKGASLAANTVRNGVRDATLSAFGLAPAPGEDNSNFPQE